jgi:hypothetical protein
MDFGFDKPIYLTLTRRSYNYLLQNLTSHRLKTLSSLPCILVPGFFLVIPSCEVYCLFVVSQYLIALCTRSVLSRRRIRTGPAVFQQLGVPPRGHSVEQFIIHAIMQASFSLSREVYIAVDGQLTSILDARECVCRGLLST